MGNTPSSGGGGKSSGVSSGDGNGKTIVASCGWKGNEFVCPQTNINSTNIHTGGTFPNTNSQSTSSSNWNNSTSNSGYSGGTSYSSQEQHIQSVNTALGGNVLGGAYHDGRKNRDMDDGINYQVKGIVANLNYYGFKDPKGIVLSDCALEDKDIGVLVQSLQPHPFNLTILDLGSNKLGYYSIENIFYGMRGSQEGVTTHVCKQIRSINFSNNLLDDNSANYIAKSLEYGRFPSLKYLDVSGNQITKSGESYFVKALESVKVTSISIVFATKSSFKELVDFLKTGFNYYAKEFHIKQVAMDAESHKYITDCQKTGQNVVLGGLGGVMKCSPLLTELPAFFVCLGKEIGMSLAQPETLNCLADVNKFFEQDITSLLGAFSDQDIHH